VTHNHSISSPPTVLAIDIGATTVKGARIGLDGAAEDELRLPTGTGAAAVTTVVEVCRKLRSETSLAIALAVAGNVDVEAGVVRYSANIGWRNLALRDIVAEGSRMPVTMIHDVRAACLAEAAVGLGRDCPDMLVVVIGTGLAAGIVAGGRHLVGATGSAGELGHLVIEPGGRACACGQRGCLEVYASASGIARRHAELGGAAAMTAADIVSSDEPAAVQAWTEATRSLGAGLAAATVLLDPRVIVLAGGLSEAGELLSAPVRRALQNGLAWRVAPPVLVSPLGARGGQVGAAIAAWEAQGRPTPARHWHADSLTTGDRA
jgi:glucokinase